MTLLFQVHNSDARFCSNKTTKPLHCLLGVAPRASSGLETTDSTSAVLCPNPLLLEFPNTTTLQWFSPTGFNMEDDECTDMRRSKFTVNDLLPSTTSRVVKGISWVSVIITPEKLKEVLDIIRLCLIINGCTNYFHHQLEFI